MESRMELQDDRPDQPQSTQDQPGTTFTVNIGEVELTESERNSIMNEITRAAMDRASGLRARAAAGRIIVFGRFGSFGQFGRVVVQ
jgi:hypothetical protein